jgi:hypothetical protein
MTTIEIQITVAAPDRLAVSIDYGSVETPVIGRWYADRSVLETVSEGLAELADEALIEPARDVDTAEARRDAVERLRSLGLALYQEVFKEEGDHLKRLDLDSADDGYLVFKIDRSLAHLPFEAMYDGETFLSHKFGIGRLIYAEDTRPPPALRPARPYSIVIVGDPSDDPVIRSDVEHEIDSVKRVFSDLDQFTMRIACGPEVNRSFMLSSVPGATMFHFSGHGTVSDDEDRTGIQLGDAKVLSGPSLAGLQDPPAVAFFNMCTAVSKEAWRGSLGLVETMLRRGTRSCIASLWDLRSTSATLVATRFYVHLLNGATFGQALRRARHEAISKHGLHDLTWAAYALYGDPERKLLPEDTSAKRRSRLRRSLAIVFGLVIIIAALLIPQKLHRQDSPIPGGAVMGYLLLESTPDDARILIDGEEIGITPYAAEVPVGSHRVSIEKAGYKKWEAWVVVREKPRNVIQANLERLE